MHICSLFALLLFTQVPLAARAARLDTVEMLWTDDMQNGTNSLDMVGGLHNLHATAKAGHSRKEIPSNIRKEIPSPQIDDDVCSKAVKGAVKRRTFMKIKDGKTCKCPEGSYIGYPAGKWETEEGTKDPPFAKMQVDSRKFHPITVGYGWIRQKVEKFECIKPQAPRITEGENFVFLDVYRLAGTWSIPTFALLQTENKSGSERTSKQNAAETVNSSTAGLYHSEMLICPKNQFNEEQKRYLQDLLKDPQKAFAKVPEEWWDSDNGNAVCQMTGYGGSDSSDGCSGVFSWGKQLKARSAMISNIDEKAAFKYLYGTTDLSGSLLKPAMCQGHCRKKWSGHQYNPLHNNCNTFTSTALKCALGLSQEKPGLGISDMVTVKECMCGPA